MLFFLDPGRTKSTNPIAKILQASSRKQWVSRPLVLLNHQKTVQILNVNDC